MQARGDADAAGQGLGVGVGCRRGETTPSTQSPASLGLLGHRDAAASATVAAACGAVARGGGAATARLLPSKDVLLPPLRAATRRWQSRGRHPHSGQAAARAPGPARPAAAPPAGQRQPRSGHPDHGPPRRRRASAAPLPGAPVSRCGCLICSAGRTVWDLSPCSGSAWPHPSPALSPLPARGQPPRKRAIKTKSPSVSMVALCPCVVASCPPGGVRVLQTTECGKPWKARWGTSAWVSLNQKHSRVGNSLSKALGCGENRTCACLEGRMGTDTSLGALLVIPCGGAFMERPRRERARKPAHSSRVRLGTRKAGNMRFNTNLPEGCSLEWRVWGSSEALKGRQLGLCRPDCEGLHKSSGFVLSAVGSRESGEVLKHG